MNKNMYKKKLYKLIYTNKNDSLWLDNITFFFCSKLPNQLLFYEYICTLLYIVLHLINKKLYGLTLIKSSVDSDRWKKGLENFRKKEIHGNRSLQK